MALNHHVSLSIKIGEWVILLFATALLIRRLVVLRNSEALIAYVEAQDAAYEKKLSTLPKDEASCGAASGSWTEFDRSGRFYCSVRTRDSAKSCKSSDDCVGLCIRQDDGSQGTKNGTCSATLPLHGCYAELQGIEISSVCRD